MMHRSILLALALASLACGPSARAQGLPVGEFLPQMPVRICHGLAEAQQQAALSARFGSLPAAEDVDVRPFIAPGCGTVSVRLHLDRIVTSVKPVLTWRFMYDPQPSAPTIAIQSDSTVHRVGYRIAKQLVRYYEARYEQDGRWYAVVAELPDDPIFLAYLKARRP
jgi:hypothetical protein